MQPPKRLWPWFWAWRSVIGRPQAHSRASPRTTSVRMPEPPSRPGPDGRESRETKDGPPARSLKKPARTSAQSPCGRGARQGGPAVLRDRGSRPHRLTGGRAKRRQGAGWEDPRAPARPPPSGLRRGAARRAPTRPKLRPRGKAAPPLAPCLQPPRATCRPRPPTTDLQAGNLCATFPATTASAPAAGPALLE